jgi:hypothetical protein
MTSLRFLGALLVAAALLSPVVLAGTASAETHPRHAMTLRVVPQQEGAAGTEVYLRCRPAGGSHPNATAACDDIATAGGDLDNLPDRTGEACTMEYSPVTVYANGWWACKTVTWEREYGNLCVARLDTGSVFDF